MEIDEENQLLEKKIKAAEEISAFYRKDRIQNEMMSERNLLALYQSFHADETPPEPATKNTPMASTNTVKNHKASEESFEFFSPPAQSEIIPSDSNVNPQIISNFDSNRCIIDSENNAPIENSSEASETFSETQMLDDLLEGPLLEERLKIVEESARKVKQRNEMMSVPQFFLNVDEGKHSGSGDIDKDLYNLVFDDEESRQRSRKTQNEVIEQEKAAFLDKSFNSNVAFKAVLLERKRHLQESLRKNLLQQNYLLNIISSSTPTTDVRNSFLSLAIFGAPYFKDKSGRACPPNPQRQRQLSQKQQFSTEFVSARWTDNDSSLLTLGVTSFIKSNLIKNLYHKIENIKDLGKKKDKKCIPELRDQIDGVHDQIRKIKAMELKELILEWGENEIDWHEISATSFSDKHSAQECQAHWHLSLGVCLNKSVWDQTDDEKLLELAKMHNYEDWDTIAVELGTNRSGLACYVHYQRDLNKNKKNIGKWSSLEDDKLVSAIKKHKIGDVILWNRVAIDLKERTFFQIHSRWTKSLEPNIKKGPFSRQEDRIIMETVEQFGRHFGKVQEFLPHRLVSQIRARFHRLEPKCKKEGRWTLEEDKSLVELVEKIGFGNWKTISEHFVTRTRTQVRQRYKRIKKFLDSYPGLILEDMIRINQPQESIISSNVSDCEETGYREVSKEHERGAEVRSKPRVRDATASEDNRISNSSRKRSACSIGIDSKTHETTSGDNCISNPKRKRLDSSNIFGRKHSKEPRKFTGASLKLLEYFQDSPPMELLCGKRKLDLTSKAKLVLDLCHLLNVDFSYMNDKGKFKFIRPFEMRILSRTLFENHGNSLLKLNPLNAISDDAPIPNMPQSTSDISCEVQTSGIDYKPCKVDNTLFLTGLEDLNYFQNEIIQQQPCSSLETNYPSETVQVNNKCDLWKLKKKESMDFPFLMPPNICTAVGFRSLLLIERKTKMILNKDKNAMSNPFAENEDNEEEMMSDSSKDDQSIVSATSGENFMRFSKKEAAAMFKERMLILFGAPMALAEYSEHSIDRSNFPRSKKEPRPAMKKGKKRIHYHHTHYKMLKDSRMNPETMAKASCSSQRMKTAEIKDGVLHTSINALSDNSVSCQVNKLSCFDFCSNKSMPSLDTCISNGEKTGIPDTASGAEETTTPTVSSHQKSDIFDTSFVEEPAPSSSRKSYYSMRSRKRIAQTRTQKL